jgi:hypothetical protein
VSPTAFAQAFVVRSYRCRNSRYLLVHPVAGAGLGNVQLSGQDAAPRRTAPHVHTVWSGPPRGPAWGNGRVRYRRLKLERFAVAARRAHEVREGPR